MTDGTTGPTLSVVIATLQEPCSVIENFEGLRRQVSAVNGQLVVVSSTAARTPPPSDIRIHQVVGGSVFDCRAAAPAIASGEIIAFTEDHCVHPPDWCERILRDFSAFPGLLMLGGAVANGSTRRIEDLMNYWMTFAAFAPGQVTARHPCIAQLIVKASAIDSPLRSGDLEIMLIRKLQTIPDAIRVDPELIVRHEQSHGFARTFAVHFHNGRATGAFSQWNAHGRRLATLQSLWRGWRDAKTHFSRSKEAFGASDKPFFVRAGYLSLILPLIIAHGIGAVVGYRRGPGASAHHLV